MTRGGTTLARVYLSSLGGMQTLVTYIRRSSLNLDPLSRCFVLLSSWCSRSYLPITLRHLPCHSYHRIRIPGGGLSRGKE